MSSVSIRQSWPLLLVFFLAVLGIGLVVGLIATPDDYVEKLRMPPFVMPQVLSSGISLALSIAFAVAGWRSWILDSNSTEMRLWLAVLILSWWFSPAFFMVRSPPLALAVAAAMLVLMLWFSARTWNRDRLSFWLFAPSVPYIAYITAMTAAIVAMN
jgi:tryptophan-rich sensory protein